MHDVAVREKQRVNAEQPKPTAAHHTLTNARLPDNTLSSWSGANPSGPWPAQAVSHGDDALKLDQISAIFAHLHSSWSQPAACVHDSPQITSAGPVVAHSVLTQVTDLLAFIADLDPTSPVAA